MRICMAFWIPRKRLELFKNFIPQSISFPSLSFRSFTVGLSNVIQCPRQEKPKHLPVSVCENCPHVDALVLAGYWIRQGTGKHIKLLSWFSREPPDWWELIVKILSFLILLRYSWFTVLISAVQQNDSVIPLHILFHILFHCGLSEDTEHNSMCYAVESCWGRWGRISSLRLADTNDYM